MFDGTGGIHGRKEIANVIAEYQHVWRPTQAMGISHPPEKDESVNRYTEEAIIV